MARSWQLGDRTLGLERPVGVGIVNVTEDSFFEGARSETPEQAVRDGLRLVEAGFRAIKLRIHGETVREDVAIVESVRRAVGPVVRIERRHIGSSRVAAHTGKERLRQRLGNRR